MFFIGKPQKCTVAQFERDFKRSRETHFNKITSSAGVTKLLRTSKNSVGMYLVWLIVFLIQAGNWIYFFPGLVILCKSLKGVCLILPNNLQSRLSQEEDTDRRSFNNILTIAYLTRVSEKKVDKFSRPWCVCICWMDLSPSSVGKAMILILGWHR